MTFWHLIQPSAGTNGWPNPSLETNTTGWAGTVSATVAREAGTAAFGAWAAKVTPNAAANSGVTFGTVLVPDVGTHTVSAYIYGGSGSVYSIGLKGPSAGAAFIFGSIAGTTGGTWHRYTMTYGDQGAAANRLFAVVKRSAGNDPFFVDGVQIEGGSVATTYMDGDQEGVTWTGAPHASSSSRSGTTRAGGRVVSLESLGLTVLEQGGGGMAPVANIMQEYAIADGALWQRQRATARPLTLTSLMSGTTWPGLHAIRQTVIDAVKINTTPNPQPVRFLYTGAGGTAVLDAYYDSGMQFEARRGFSETMGLRFVAPDPYWTATTDAGTQLIAQVNLGSFNYIGYRDPLGRWGTMGVAGTTLRDFLTTSVKAGVAAIYVDPSGTVFVGGDFGTAGGTKATGIAMFLPTAGQWGTLAGGTLMYTTRASIEAITRSPAGTLFVGGFIGTAGGTRALHLASWNGAWGTLGPGTADNGVSYLDYAPSGTLYMSGNFLTVGGTVSGPVAFHNGANYGTTSGGTVGIVEAPIAVGPDNKLYVGARSAGGTAAGTGIYIWGGAWGSTRGSADAASLSAEINALDFGPDGRLYIVGAFTAYSGGTVNSIAVFNGNQFSGLSSGLTDRLGTDALVRAVLVRRTGEVYAVGTFNRAGSITVPDSIARWNNAWLPMDIDIPLTDASFTNQPFQATALAESTDGTLYVGGAFAGTATAAGITTIINSGAADAYPRAVLRNTSAANIRLYQLANMTTGDGLWTDITMLPGETLTLDLRNNQKTFTSDFRGNVLTAVLPASNLTTWKLAPGTNIISLFASSGSVETAFYYRPRAWSQDDVL